MRLLSLTETRFGHSQKSSRRTAERAGIFGIYPIEKKLHLKSLNRRVLVLLS